MCVCVCARRESPSLSLSLSLSLPLSLSLSGGHPVLIQDQGCRTMISLLSCLLLGAPPLLRAVPAPGVSHTLTPSHPHHSPLTHPQNNDTAGTIPSTNPNSVSLHPLTPSHPHTLTDSISGKDLADRLAPLASSTPGSRHPVPRTPERRGSVPTTSSIARSSSAEPPSQARLRNQGERGVFTLYMALHYSPNTCGVWRPVSGEWLLCLGLAHSGSRPLRCWLSIDKHSPNAVCCCAAILVPWLAAVASLSCYTGICCPSYQLFLSLSSN